MICDGTERRSDMKTFVLRGSSQRNILFEWKMDLCTQSDGVVSWKRGESISEVRRIN